jgi:hypothetical protein
MGLLLAVLAYMVYMLMTCNDNKTTTSVPAAPAQPAQPAAFTNTNRRQPPVVQHFTNAQVAQPVAQHVAQQVAQPVAQHVGQINYENFENAPGPVEEVTGAEPAVFKNAEDMEETQYAKVNYTGLVDANPEDVLQIEGTDLLTAPLVDNMLYTNSIANTNRNASNDLRGDIPLQFNESYTPFYSSVIYGAPLSERAMTLGSLPQYGPVGPVGPFGKGITATA